MNANIVELLKYITRGSDAEREQQMRLDEIDRASSARIAEQKAASQQTLEQERVSAQQKQETLFRSVFQDYKSKGLPDNEAMQAASRTLAQMQVADPYQQMSSAELSTAENRGALPASTGTGLLQEQAKGMAAEASRTGDIARSNINRVAADQGPISERKRQQSLQSGFDLSNATSAAQMPYTAPLAQATNQSTIESATNQALKDIAARKSIPALISGQAGQQIAESTLGQKQAEQGVATLAPTNLLNTATTAKLQSDIAKSRFEAANPGLKEVGNLNAITLEMIQSNPRLLDALKAAASGGGVNANISPVTPTGIPDRSTTGTLRPRGNIRIP